MADSFMLERREAPLPLPVMKFIKPLLELGVKHNPASELGYGTARA